MGILDGFTGAAAKKASAAQIAGLRDSNDILQWGGDNARDEYENALKLLKRQYGVAGDLYKPMTEMGLGGVNAYQTAMGLGPGGMDAGTAAFRNTPGYKFALDEGTDAALRSASARGMLASGNTDADLMRLGTGLADQTYGSYLQRLTPLMNMYGTGVTGQANAATGYGNAGANMYSNMANSYMNEGNSRAGVLGQIGQAQAGGIMGAANAQGGLLNSILGGVGELAKLPLSGGGSLGGSLVNRLFT